MKVILFGGTGMVGQGVLRECLRDREVTEVLAVTRSATGQQHAKLREIVHKDFNDFSALQLEGDACFWCLGVSSTGMSEADYTRITVQGRVRLPAGHDSTAAGNQIAHTFVQRAVPALYPLIHLAKLVTPQFVTNTERVGRAMLRIAKRGFPKKVLENPDINVASGY